MDWKDEVDPGEMRRVLERMDILAEVKKFGFIPLGPPDAAGWQSGRCPEPVG